MAQREAEAARLEAEKLEAARRDAAKPIATPDAKGKSPALRRPTGFLSGIAKTGEEAPQAAPQAPVAPAAAAASTAQPIAASAARSAVAPAQSRAQTGAVEGQLKAKFAEVVARKETPAQPAGPVDTRDRIAEIFRKVQSDSTKRTVTEARAPSPSDATDRIANIMRKGLQPGQVNPSARADAKPATPKAAEPMLPPAASAPQSVTTLFETAPAAPAQAYSKVASQLIEWLKAELAEEPDMNHVTVLTIVGALAGYAAQRAIWEGVVQTGGLSPTDVFEVRMTDAGETFYFSSETDKLMVVPGVRLRSLRLVVIDPEDRLHERLGPGAIGHPGEEADRAAVVPAELGQLQGLAVPRG